MMQSKTCCLDLLAVCWNPLDIFDAIDGVRDKCIRIGHSLHSDDCPAVIKIIQDPLFAVEELVKFDGQK